MGRARQEGRVQVIAGAEEFAIRQIEARFNDTWNRHDPDGMVESLTDDG